MELYGYIEDCKELKRLDVSDKCIKEGIIIHNEIGEFIIKKKPFIKIAAKKYLAETLRKNGDYYLDVKNIYGICHCIFIEKSRLDEVLELVKALSSSVKTPMEFIIDQVENRPNFTGSLYVNLGDWIYLTKIVSGKISEILKFFKDGYMVTDVNKVDFFISSIVWVEEINDTI